MKKVDLSLSNYYGSVYAFNIDGKCHMELENYSGVDTVDISLDTFNALAIEFGVIDMDDKK